MTSLETENLSVGAGLRPHSLVSQKSAPWSSLRRRKHSSLIIGMFGEKGVVNCRDDEHAGIIQALRSGDASLVEELMRRHIDHLCRNIDFGKARTTSDDLAEVFKE